MWALTGPDSKNGKDLHKLVRAAKEGDLLAFNRLVLEYQDLAYTLACYVLGDEDSSGMAIQNGFLHAFRKLRSYHGASFRAWLLRQVLSACRSPELLPAPKVRVDGDPVVGTLRALPFDARLAVVLVDFLGLDYPEAAYICGCSQNVFTQKLARARFALADAG